MDLKEIIKMRLLVGLVVFSLLTIAFVIAACNEERTLDMVPPEQPSASAQAVER